MVLFATFFLMLVLSGLAISIGVESQNAMVSGRNQLQDKQAFFIAEAGWQRARQAVSDGTWDAAADPGNTYTESFGAGEYLVTVVAVDDDEYSITSKGYVPSQANAVAQRQVVEENISATVSSTNLSLSATASASSSDSSHPAADAIDGSSGSHWKAGSDGSGWLKLDFGSATTLDEIIVEEKDNVTNVSVEYSDNGSTWSTPSGHSVSHSGKTWTVTFTGTSHRYFRANISASSSKKPSVKELESYNTAADTVTLGQGDVTTRW